MIVHSVELERLHLTAGKLYVILPYSNGDTFNAVLYLQKHPPRIPYQMIVKKNQAAVVTLLLERFGRLPEHLFIVNHFSGHMADQLMQRFPALPWYRGMIPDCVQPGCVVAWDGPARYHLNWRLDAEDIAAWRAHFANLPCAQPIEGEALIFSVSANDPPPTRPDFERLAQCLRERLDVPQYSNVSGIREYGQEHVPGTTPISPSLDELLKLAYRPNSPTYFIGLRSGLFDLLRFSDCRQVVFYCNERPVVYQSMRLGLMQSAISPLELQYGQDMSIHYPNLAEVIRRFLLSRDK